MAVVLWLIVPIDAARSTSLPRTGPEPFRIRWFHYLAFKIAVALLIPLTYVSLLPILPLRQFRVPSGGMMPTLRVGDYFIVDRRTGALSSVALGDIVVFESPAEPGNEYVKRLAGLPGNVVEVRDGLLYVDGVDRSSAVAPAQRDAQTAETLGRHTYQVFTAPAPTLRTEVDFGPQRVPGDSLFVLGDNRWNSRDSRSIGAVPRRCLRGRVLRLHWSEDPRDKRIRWERVGMSLLER
jgi:signal peptidase I